MPDINVSIPHQLTRAEAKQRIQEQIAIARQRHGGMLSSVQEDWNDDTLAFRVAASGQAVSGHLTVGDQTVNLTVNLPWYLSILAGTIRHRLENEARLLLSGGKADA